MPSPSPSNSNLTTILRGINRSGAEFGSNWNGWTPSDTAYYKIPTGTAYATELALYKAKGFNLIRFPIAWERMQHVLNGSLDPAYSASIKTMLKLATDQGFKVILDLHNYNRYAIGALGTTFTQHVMGDGTLTMAHLTDVWSKMAALVSDNPNVILELMNEPHDFPMTSTAHFAGLQGVINAIRNTGNNSLILVPNSRGSDVDHWSSYSPNGGPTDAIAALVVTDPLNNYAFAMHAYQDNPTSVISYSALLTNVTNWAIANHKKLMLTEMGSAKTATNGAAGIGGALAYMKASPVWLGWSPWNIDPYNEINYANWTYSGDGIEMPWYAPYLK